MPTNKMLSTLFVGKVKSILKETETANKVVMKDTSLEQPIMQDVILSNKSNAYDKILVEYKNYREKKKANNEE